MKKNKDRFDAAYQSAVELMEQEWLQAGMSREELERSKCIADSLDTLAAYGMKLDSVSGSGRSLVPATLSSLQTRLSELEQRVRALEEAKSDPDLEKLEQSSL